MNSDANLKVNKDCTGFRASPKQTAAATAARQKNRKVQPPQPEEKAAADESACDKMAGIVMQLQ